MEELEVADMRIIIKKCSFDKYWYSKHIGDVFFVESYCSRDYYILFDGNLRAILRADAEFLNKKNPLI